MPHPDPQNPTHIRPGQVWKSAHPMEVTTVRVVSMEVGRVSVVDAHDGKRPRQIWAHQFHASPSTRAGRPRLSGYILKKDAPADYEESNR
ncbi:hypothetical protein ACWFMI_24920 [Nocardiopsis terrae]|uniref:hypothetical protein n=1 Tax=Streptomyces sp. NPDC057554 TaxID=3350538 RepID=UPI0036920AA2